MVKLTQPEKIGRRFMCYAFSDSGDPNEVIAMLENNAIKKREVKDDDGVPGWQVTKAEANKLEHCGAQFLPKPVPPPPSEAVKQALTTAVNEAPPVPLPPTPAPEACDHYKYAPESRPAAEVAPDRPLVISDIAIEAAIAQTQAAKPAAVEAEPERPHHKTSPSSLQAREACSHYDSEQSESEAAQAGTRQHKAVERRSTDGLPNDEEATAVQNCIEFTNSIEFQFAEKAKAAGTQYIHLNEVYLHVDDRDTSAGYLDEAFILGEEAALIDYKFGQWEVEPAENNLQAMAYSLGLFKQYPQLQNITVYFVMPYLQTIDYAVYTRAQQQEMLLRIVAVVERNKAKAGEPTPNFLGCYSCANKGTCPALAKLAIKISQKFAPLQIPDNFEPMKIENPDDAATGMKLASLIEKWAWAYKGRITNLAVEDDKFMPPGYIMIRSADRKITDTRAAHAVLKTMLTDDQIWSILKLGVTGIEDAIKAAAPKGEKGARAQEVLDILEAKGLIKREDEKVYLRATTKARDIE